MYFRSRHISVSALLLIAGFSLPNVLGWHENLGISDEQATQFYKTNPQDPQIVGWQNGVQQAIDTFGELCFEGGWINPTSDECIASAKEIVALCASHQGQLLACFDPRISESAQQHSTIQPAPFPECVEIVDNTTVILLDEATKTECEGIVEYANHDYYMRLGYEKTQELNADRLLDSVSGNTTMKKVK